MKDIPLAPSEIKKTLRTFVVDTFLFGDERGLRDDSSFLNEGIIDSTGVLELVAHLEETYQLQLKDAEMVPENLDSIDALAALLLRKQAESSR